MACTFSTIGASTDYCAYILISEEQNKSIYYFGWLSWENLNHALFLLSRKCSM